MEERLDNGYQLYVTKDIDIQRINGVYTRQQNGASTRIQTKEKELDFIRILPTVEEHINEGYTLVLGKIENKFYAYLTDQKQEIKKYETYNQFFLNSLVDIEEKAKSFEKLEKGRGGK